ncbi:MAG: 3-hydroxyacyl-CoA dehydrogenase NAD-binding domain-containing protein, partial [Pseudomonadota bacterium]
GGLEIAMGCHFRLAQSGTRIGQPEVNLGIPPGGGGTQRLPRLFGVERAMKMILSGDPIRADDAVGTDLVHAVLESGDDIIDRAADALGSLLDEGSAPSSARNISLDAIDGEVFNRARADAAKRRRGQPAATACIDCVEAATKMSFDEGLAFERERFLECVSSPEAASMRHVFFAERAAAKPPKLGDGVAIPDIESIAVIGAGTMGRGISLAFVEAGYPVTVIESNADALENCLNIVHAHLQASVDKKRISEAEAQARRERYQSSTSLDDCASADLIIEAIFEEMDVKKTLFKKLGTIAKPDAILASNTSYLDVDKIASVLPERLPRILGLHFFSPANIMKLLEIVRAEHTAPEVLATALGLAKRLKKIGVVAGVCQGFIANRMLEPYMREAEFLLQEGATPAQIDAAFYHFGFPMGPFAVRDLAGLDIGWARRKSIAHLRDPALRYSTVGDEICEQGWFGQKTGKGYYIYEAGSRTPKPNPEVEAMIRASAEREGIEQRDISNEEIIQRCLYDVVNEGARELEEGIARRASDIDLAWIYGYGFPRWRGGPMFWADQIGLPNILETIRELSTSHDYWEPAPLLVSLAESGKSFGDWVREG